MNLAVWAQMQSLEILQRVDEMLDIDVEDDLLKLSSHSHISRNGNRSLKRFTRGHGKVAAGVSLVAIGLAGLLDPTKAWQARKIQLAFALAGAYIGSMLGMGLAGFGIGSVVGGVVAAVYLYAVPMITIASGIYLIVDGLFEMV